MWKLLQPFIQSTLYAFKKHKVLDDKFSEAEFKLDTIQLMNQIVQQKKNKLSTPINFMAKYYQKVFSTQTIDRTASRKIIEYTLPDLPDEDSIFNETNQDNPTGPTL